MNEDLNQYQTAYNPTFKFYDENHWYLKKYAHLMIDKIRDENLKSVLSLGIGHEVVSTEIIRLLQNGILEYHIVEGSKDIINKFKERETNQSIVMYHSFFENFETDKKFDAIEMGFVLEHVDDPFVIIDRFKNFLSENGIMFISVPNAKSLHRLIGHEAGLLDDMYKLSPADLELGHKRYFDIEKISALIDRCDLKIESKKGLMLKPITGAQIAALGWGQNIISALMKVGENYPEISNCMYLEVKK